MNMSARFAVALGLATTVWLGSSFGYTAVDPAVAAPPEIAYLKEVNSWRPSTDPQLLFILMAEFSNAGRRLEGIDYFEQQLKSSGRR